MLTITLSETIRILLILVFLFILCPLLFMKKSNSTLPLSDRFFFGFISLVLFQIVSVHVLVLIKLNDVISLTALALFTALFLIKYDRKKEMVITRLLAKLYFVYDAMDTPSNRKSFFHHFRTGLGNNNKILTEWIKNRRKAPVFSLLFLLVTALTTASRLWHSLVHYAYPHMDMYLHLKWIKAIMSNDLYLDDKIYPKAMHSVIAFLSRTTFSDPYWILRYFGPFCAVLLVFSIYYLAFKVTGNKYLSLLAMALYGLIINNSILPSEVFRQTATMPQEFGMLFIVLGLAFLIDYIKTLHSRNLFAFEACLLIGLMSHSFSGLFLIFWTAVTVVLTLIFRVIQLKEAVKLIWISALVSAASFVPLVIGILFGKVFHETSLEMVTDVTGIKISDLYFEKYFQSLLSPNSILLRILVLGSVVLLILAIFRKLRVTRSDLPVYLSIFLSTIIIYMAYSLPSLIKAEKLPELLDETRTGPFLSLLLPVCIAIIVVFIIDFLILFFTNMNETVYNRIKSFIYNCVIAAFIVISLTNGIFSLNTFYKHVEYDQAAEAYIRIRSEFAKNSESAGNWYVVATDPQFAQVKNYGWYEEGYKFAQDHTKEQVMDPNFRFNYPVNHIFIFVEKKPLFFNKAITPEYGEQEIEPLSDDPFMQFYQDGNNRAVMEGHIWMIAQAYAETHDNVSIYYEDDEFIIYRIYQEEVVLPQ